MIYCPKMSAMNITEGIPTIIDRGGGPQLAGHRIYVQHLLPYFKNGTPDAEILRWLPTINQAELDVVRQYYLDHTEEVLELEKRLDEQSIELQKKYARPPSEFDGLPREERIAAMKRRVHELREKRQANGKPHAS